MATRIVIIGGGPAGYEAALVAAARGREVAEVTVVDCDGIGGACVLWDCVPSKTFIASTGVRTELRRAPDLGFDLEFEDAKISLPQINERVKTLAAAAVRRHRRPAAQRGRHAHRGPRRARRRRARHGRTPRQGHHARRLDERARRRRRADRHRRQPAGAARRGARRRAHPELAPALRPRRRCPSTWSSSAPASPAPSSSTPTPSWV